MYVCTCVTVKATGVPEVGAGVGTLAAYEGKAEGAKVGEAVGALVGAAVGARVGEAVGALVGVAVGCRVGKAEGSGVGSAEGAAEGPVGDRDGVSVGEEGLGVGGVVGTLVGLGMGLNEGARVGPVDAFTLPVAATRIWATLLPTPATVPGPVEVPMRGAVWRGALRTLVPGRGEMIPFVFSCPSMSRIPAVALSAQRT